MTRVVLGSASTGRLKVLRQAGIDPEVVVSGVDEDAVIAALDAGSAPGQVVCALATAKAADVAARLSPGVAADCVVIGCDSMLYLDGALCGKPASTDAARRQWRTMAGRTGELHTGHSVSLLTDGSVRRTVTASASTTVHFGEPSRADLEAYLASGEPMKVAGGFTLDGLGGWFIEGVAGDPSNVIGLSLPLMRKLLSQLEIDITRLWADNAVG